MICPKCGSEMNPSAGTDTTAKKLVKITTGTAIGGAIGSIVSPIGIGIGALVGLGLGSLYGNKEKGYQECPKCNYSGQK